MTKSYIEPVDPTELASRFSTEDSIETIPEGLDEDWKEEHLEEIKKVMDRLPDKEADIVDLYFFKNKKQTSIAEIFDVTQAAISYRLQRAMARIRFLVDMPDATKHDVYRDLKEWSILTEEMDAQIFAEMYETSCQSEVANRLNISQGQVRHRFLSNLEEMASVVLNRLENWVQSEIDGEKEQEYFLDEIENTRRTHRKGKMEDAEFENAIRNIVRALRNRDFDLGDLGLLFDYFETFVKIRYNYNILREIELPQSTDDGSKILA